LNVKTIETTAVSIYSDVQKSVWMWTHWCLFWVLVFN